MEAFKADVVAVSEEAEKAVVAADVSVDRVQSVRMEDKEIVFQSRLRSWVTWVAVAGAVWTIASAFGLPQKYGIEAGTAKKVLDAVGTILIGFGILNNPTDSRNF